MVDKSSVAATGVLQRPFEIKCNIVNCWGVMCQNYDMIMMHAIAGNSELISATWGFFTCT